LTGLPAQLVLVQWALESDFGIQPPARNNLAGITIIGSGEGHWQPYPTLEDFTTAYAGLLLQPAYTDVIASARSGAPDYIVARFLGASSWSTDHYTGQNGYDYPGGALVALLDSSVARRIVRELEQDQRSVEIGLMVLPMALLVILLAARR